MNREELSTRIRACLGRIAPEVDVGALQAAVRLRDQVDLDSVDWLNFLIAVHADLGVDIPDADAARLATLDQLIEYCERPMR